MSILGDGCTVNQGSRIVHSVIGLRSRIGQDCLIEDTMLMGADYYEQGAELDECARLDKCVPIGVGSGSHVSGTGLGGGWIERGVGMGRVSGC